MTTTDPPSTPVRYTGDNPQEITAALDTNGNVTAITQTPDGHLTISTNYGEYTMLPGDSIRTEGESFSLSGSNHHPDNWDVPRFRPTEPVARRFYDELDHVARLGHFDDKSPLYTRHRVIGLAADFLAYRVNTEDVADLRAAAAESTDPDRARRLTALADRFYEGVTTGTLPGGVPHRGLP